MRNILLGMVAFVTLTGCKPSATSNTCTTHLQSPFSQEKVQLRNQNPMIVAFGAASATAIVNSAFSVRAAPTTVSNVIKKGTELVAVMRDRCLKRPETPSGMTSTVWVAPRDMTQDELSRIVRDDACIVGISDKVILTHNAAYSDPDVSLQTHLQTIDQPNANTLFLDPAKGITKDVVIAVIDTGVDINHEDLRDNLWVNANEIPGNGIDDDNNGYIDDINGWNFADNSNNVLPECGGECSHGTHVSGLAAARGGNGVGGAGVMGQHVKIMALNVFGNSTGANNSAIDNAIRYAADNGADVINMSLGGPGASPSTEHAITYALSKGVTVVVAAGNDSALLDSNNFETPASYSGMYTGVIAVGSIDASTTNLSYFSNYGANVVKIGAPGSDSVSRTGLFSTLPGNTYGRMQGTSMASPVAAGGAALATAFIKSRGQSSTPALVEDALLSSGKVVASLGSSFKNGKLLNLASMASYLDAKYGGIPPATGVGGGNHCQ